jgi:uncharacterized membrane protein HdeD (DUF308 family)
MDFEAINNFIKTGAWGNYIPATLFLAKIIGLYLIITGLYLLFRYDTLKQITSEFSRSKALQAISGFISLILGLLIVISHPVWVWDWPVLITLFGYLGILKGISRLFFPEWEFGRKWTDNTFLVYFGALSVLLGLFLTYKGFWQ